MVEDRDVRCNMCGRQIQMRNDVLLEDAFEAKKEWGYFSNKDLEVHRFILCEECYDGMVAGFAIPLGMDYKREILGVDM